MYDTPGLSFTRPKLRFGNQDAKENHGSKLRGYETSVKLGVTSEGEVPEPVGSRVEVLTERGGIMAADLGGMRLMCCWARYPTIWALRL